MFLTALTAMMEASVATGDNRNVGLWIVLAGAALVLIVLSVAMSAAKKSEKKNADKKNQKNK